APPRTSRSHRLFVRFWMHNGSVLVGGEKMSKSKGNFTTIGDAIEKYGAALLRFYVVTSHYRSPTDYSETTMRAAKEGWERIQLADQNAARILGLPRRSDASAGADRLREDAQALRRRFFEA